MKSRTTLTEKEQRIAVDFLENLIFSGIDAPREFFDKMIERYGLKEDPYTKLPCTSEEYDRNSVKYAKELMFEKYGHCDGID